MGKISDVILARIREHGATPGSNATREQLKDPGYCKRASDDHKVFVEASRAIEILGNLINSSGNNHIIRSAIVNELNKTHRYLQNELILTLFLGLGDLGALYNEDPLRFSDARNNFGMGLLVKLRDEFHDELHYELFWRS